MAYKGCRLQDANCICTFCASSSDGCTCFLTSCTGSLNVADNGTYSVSSDPPEEGFKFQRTGAHLLRVRGGSYVGSFLGRLFHLLKIGHTLSTVVRVHAGESI